MFGHQDNQKDTNLPINNQLADTSLKDTSSPTVVTAPAQNASASDWPEPPLQHGQLPSLPQPAINDTSDIGSLASTEPAKSAPELPTAAEPSNDLLDIKQQALQQLSPLVSHLDQSPEEKFRTLMMMIQASDNQSLINSAYQAAQAIDNEKVKAQALLDIVNEINYFTHPHEA